MTWPGCYREDMILVAGSINMDLVARVPQIAAPGQTVLGHGFARHHGGKGANQAVAAARLGAAVAFVGALGRDAFGDELLAGLLAQGIDVGGVQRVEEPSGCALISVSDEGENAISVLPGANGFAPQPPPTWFADWLLLQLEIPLPTCLAWAQAAQQLGVRVMLNAAPMQRLPPALLRCVDTLVVNEGELTANVGQELNLNDALAHVASQGPRCVVVTLGARGCRVWFEGAVTQLDGHSVQVVDSTGAGDTFVGALAAGLDGGLLMPQALRRANAAAALSCTVAGARGGMPTAQAVALVLQQNTLAPMR